MMRALVPARIGQAWVLLDAEIIREILGAEVWLPIPGARADEINLRARRLFHVRLHIFDRYSRLNF